MTGMMFPLVPNVHLAECLQGSSMLSRVSVLYLFLLPSDTPLSGYIHILLVHLQSMNIRVFPVWGYYECCCKHLCKTFVWTLAFLDLKINSLHLLSAKARRQVSALCQLVRILEG